jgi:hypothetical protein
MTAAVASPIAWLSIMRTESIALFWIFRRQRRYGNEPTRGLHWRSGPGRSAPSRSRSPNASWWPRPRPIVDHALGRWGTPSTVFPAEIRAAYVRALQDSARAHAICEDAVWSARGALNSWYAEDSGPIALQRAWGDDVEGHPLDAGHFFPEEARGSTVDALDRFFRRD